MGQLRALLLLDTGGNVWGVAGVNGHLEDVELASATIRRCPGWSTVWLLDQSLSGLWATVEGIKRAMTTVPRHQSSVRLQGDVPPWYWSPPCEEWIPSPARDSTPSHTPQWYGRRWDTLLSSQTNQPGTPSLRSGEESCTMRSDLNIGSRLQTAEPSTGLGRLMPSHVSQSSRTPDAG